ncbi:MAG: hypothetical protein Q4D62_12530, partial [Planctomycetia bacterium]|nr:hypothetical protein [Planctomycetia bacterium]
MASFERRIYTVENEGVYETVITYTFYEDGTCKESKGNTQKCETTNEDYGYVVNEHGLPILVDGVPRYPNGNPFLDGDDHVLDEDGELKYPGEGEGDGESSLKFDSAVVKPDWNNPMDPTPNGENPSGYLELSGKTDFIGYNGSDLRYYFNNETSKNIATITTLSATVATGAVNVAAATGAVAVSWTSGPGAVAVAAAQEAIAIATETIYSAQLAEFLVWSENYVGAIDFNSSYTVTGGGTLAGTYQNIETMLLEKGDYTVTGQILVVDRLYATDNLTVDTTGRIAVVNSIQIDKDLTNNGIITEINQLTVSGKLTNSGEMRKINVLSAKDVENSGTITVGDATVSNLVNKGNWAAKGEVNATSIGNSGSLHAGGSLIVSGAITNSNSFSALGTITADSISQTGKDSIWLSKGTIDTKSLNIEGGSFTSSGAVTVENSLTNSGVTVFGNSLKAGSIQNDTGGTILTLGTTKIDGKMENKGIWYANASIKSGIATNSGTIGILGDWDTESVTNSGKIDLTGNLISKGVIENTKDISGTSAAASMQGTSLSNSGNIQNFRNILFTGSSGSANEGMISGLGANSSLTLYGDLRNEGTIQEFSSLSTVNMTNTGTILGTGLNSVIQLSGTLSNTGAFAAWEKFSVNEKTVNNGTISGVGEGSVYRFGDGLENDGTVSEVEKLSVTGDLTNTETIEGTGKDSLLKVSGKLTNAEEASIQNYESLTVDGELSNSGKLIATG